MNDNNLWTALEKDNEYLENKALYQSHILEQYKIYVEMADRISARRNLSNVFFLTLHTSIITAIGFALGKIEIIKTEQWTATFPLAAIVILCYVWWRLIKSYRQLNTAKYQVIGDLEKKLPASPYWAAEWKALGEGKDDSKYSPLTHLEHFVPMIFGLLYIIIWGYIILLK
jgi:hypothetical protein